MICPHCKSNKICNIGSSTLPIINNKYIDGSNVDKKTLKLHKSIKHICTDCLLEFGDKEAKNATKRLKIGNNIGKKRRSFGKV